MPVAPRALFLTGDETGSAMWRAWHVCDALQRRGFTADFAPINGCPKCGGGGRSEDERLADTPWTCPRCQHTSRASEGVYSVLPLVAAGHYDLIVTPRIVWPDEGVGDKWINVIHKAGLAWVYEADDDVWSATIVQRQMHVFESERNKGEQRLEWERLERIRLLHRCDGVTVSSTRLRTAVLRHDVDVPVMVIENAIDVSWFRRMLRGVGRVPELVGKLTIGWFGGTRHDLDLAPLVEAWPRLAARHPNVQFVIQGHLPPRLVDVMPEGRVTTLPWIPLEEYPRALVNVDIGCCSVYPSLFNTSKTPIKWFEYTLAGAACVVSPFLYGPVVTDGHDALIADTAEQWETQLDRLIEDAELRRSIAHEARRTVVMQHSLERNLHHWLDAWTTILEDFHARETAQPTIYLPSGDRVERSRA